MCDTAYHMEALRKQRVLQRKQMYEEAQREAMMVIILKIIIGLSYDPTWS